MTLLDKDLQFSRFKQSEAFIVALSTLRFLCLQELTISGMYDKGKKFPQLREFFSHLPRLAKLSTGWMNPRYFNEFRQLTSLSVVKEASPILQVRQILQALPNIGLLETLELYLDEDESFEDWLKDMQEELSTMVGLRSLRVAAMVGYDAYQPDFED